MRFFLQYFYVLLCILTIQKLWYCGLPIFWHMILSIEARLRFLSAVTNSTQTNVQVGGGVSWKDHRFVKICCKMPARCMVVLRRVLFKTQSHSLPFFAVKDSAIFLATLWGPAARFFTIYKTDYYYNYSVHKWRELQKKIDVDNHLNFSPGLFFALPTLHHSKAELFIFDKTGNFIPRWRHFFINCPKIVRK